MRILKTVAMVSLVFVLLALTVLPQRRTKVYPVSCDQVWKIIETANNRRYVVLSRSGEGCKVAVGGLLSGFHYDEWGFHNNEDNSDFFRRIDDALGTKQPAGVWKGVSATLTWTVDNWLWVIAAVFLVFLVRRERRESHDFAKRIRTGTFKQG